MKFLPSGFWLFSSVTFGVLLSACGCGSQSSPTADSGDDAMMSELLSELEQEPGAAEQSAASEESEADPGVGTRSGRRQARSGLTQQDALTEGTRNISTVPVTATAQGDRLELRLQPGDRFPLIKTVEQMLVQKSTEFPAIAQTRLELTMAIQVEQEQPDAILLSVRYSRITYSHDLNGQRLDFDSATHQNDIPWDVQPYAGMVNNGFAFWVGRDNRIRDLVGYQEFLQRCVENVPLDRRQSLLAEISNRFGDDGVANFIDDSIGLLPYNSSVDKDSATRVAPGDVWTRETRLMQPAPVYLTSTYRLAALNPRTADIDITGRVASGETVSSGQDGNLKITGGHSIGKCTVDRATGLPLELNLTRFISMMVVLPDGKQVPQDKQITTTIRAFPETRGHVVQQPSPSVNRPGVQPAAAFQAESPSDRRVIPIPVTAPETSNSAVTGRAVYPD